MNYNDANDYNVLVSDDLVNPVVLGVIDFGDVVYTHTVNELAIAIAYAVMGKPDPLEAAQHVVRGFNRAFKLEEGDLAVLYHLIAARLIVSVTCSAINLKENPANHYLQVSDRLAWVLLEKLGTISPSLAHYAFREACGFEPCPAHSTFEAWVGSQAGQVSFPLALRGDPAWLDLSVGSLDLGNYEDLLDADKLDGRVAELMRDANAQWAVGRYDEARALYSTSAYVAPGNDAPMCRTVHIGLDLFVAPGSEVLAAGDGVIHSFADNQADRDYGPTIVLEHRVSDELTFHTLYGHLAQSSLASLEVGQAVNKGDVIGRVGARSENGNWPPHLHFQVILDMLDRRGEFPGVASARQRDVWKSICPDPWFLLTGTSSAQNSTLSNDGIVSYRREHLGKNMSISYREPIRIVRGFMQHLYDETGRRYLDTVNNVPHVGHEHPRVVRAGQRQMAVLNTNTRYLHDNLVKFVEALLSTLPPRLSVAFVVNSGSEANELALRLAKSYTGQKDIIVAEVGYHGNTNACVEISSYKFDGPGGGGAAPHVHVVPIPDTYRGLYRATDGGSGASYASHLQQAIAQMQEQGRRPAAFICESVISCGGQVVLPRDYLREAYRYVRQAGGVCIADEVQTGCGRAGDHFWAFEAYGVVPDVVTIGKPIGNGHPLAAVVTTQAIADAFGNGMEYFNTFGGNPVSCAIGLEVLRIIREEGLQEQARVVGNHLSQGLKALMDEHPIVGDVRGPGLFLGFELVKDRETREPATAEAAYLANRMREKNILMSTDGPYNNVLKIKPPMVFTKADADFLVASIDQVLREDLPARVSRSCPDSH